MLHGMRRFRLSSDRIRCPDTSSARDRRLHWLHVVFVGVPNYRLHQVRSDSLCQPAIFHIFISFPLSAWCQRPFRTLLNVVLLPQCTCTPYSPANRFAPANRVQCDYIITNSILFKSPFKIIKYICEYERFFFTEIKWHLFNIIFVTS